MSSGATPSQATHSRIKSRLGCMIWLTFLLAAVATGIRAQSTATNLEGNETPGALKPGAPAGSYALSGIENINIYNGNLSAGIPLLKVGGRGDASYVMTQQLAQREWTVDHNLVIYTNYSSTRQTWYSYAQPQLKQQYYTYGAGLGPGILHGRRAGKDYVTCVNGVGNSCLSTFTYLEFTAPDGTEYPLYDELSVNVGPGCQGGGAYRGKVFSSRNGAGMTFISEADIWDQSEPNDIGYEEVFTPTGYLMMPNGTRYRIENGLVKWIRDRNGNRLDFVYDTYGRVQQITDSLNRIITVQYNVQDAAPYGACHRMLFGGMGGEQRIIRISTAQSSQVGDPFPQLPGNEGIESTTLAHYVWLPDGVKHYTYYYNQYGEIRRIELPTGGACEYDYAAGVTGAYPSGQVGDSEYLGNSTPYTQDGEDPPPLPKVFIYRRLVERRVYPAGGTGTSYEGRTTYSRPESASCSYNGIISSCIFSDIGYVQEESFDNGGLSVASLRHYYHGKPAGDMYYKLHTFSGYPDTQEGKEWLTETLSGQNVVQSASRTWEARTRGPVVTQALMTLVDTNQVSKQTFSYDAFNNRTYVYEYGYGNGAPGGLLRHTHTDYLTTSEVNGLNYTLRSTANAPHLLSLVTGKKVSGAPPSSGAEILLAQTETRYDEPAYPVLPYGTITGWADPGTAARGQATTTRRWLNTIGGYIEAHAQYDQAGNVRNVWDGRGQPWQTGYSGNYSDGVPHNTYAYPTLSISPVPDIGWNFCSTTPLQTTTLYDFSTGLVRASTDANTKTTTITYSDPFDRPTRIDRPDGGYTTYGYDRNVYGDYVHTRTLLNSTTGLLTDNYSYTDGLGRLSRSFQYENSDLSSPWLTGDTQYDAMGRVWRVSNTYRSAGVNAAINPSGNWTTTQFDPLGRVKSVTAPDGATVTTSYYGNQVTVTDPAGKMRRSYIDAVGRLGAINEDPNGQALFTYYTYDALNNLRAVKQDTQRRYFMYDSLSRLIRASNPEQNVNGALAYQDIYTASGDTTANSQWSTAYSYDGNSNLLSRTDARGVTANYTYDNLNRQIRAAYPDTNSAYTDHYFDNAVNGQGLVYYSVSYVNSSLPEAANVIDTYDAVGRPLNQRQRMWVNGAWGAAYNVQRTYDQAGHVTSQTYPSGHVVSYSYDVLGRTSIFSGNLGDSVARTYMSAQAFDDSGRLTREQFGTDIPLYNKRHYNVRGQLYDIRLSSVNDELNWNRGAVVNYYSSNFSFGGSLPTNNGNLLGQQYWIPNDDAISSSSYFQQNYDYDALNRLAWVSLYFNGGTNTGFQQYIYDRYGNRTISDASWGAGINAQQFTVDTGTNRLGVPAGQTGEMAYDANGNLRNDTYSGFGTRTYDGENRMVTATNSSAGQSTYSYNGEGQRVKRQTAGQSTWQVYGIGGELVAEYAANAAPTAPRKEYGYRNGELLITADAPLAAGTNLALGKSATQSSDPFGAPASRAVDGNTNGNWANNSVTHTDYNYEGWWQVDLGSVQSISSIKLSNRTDCCAERLSNFYVLISDEPFNFTDLTNTINQSGVSSYHTLATVNGSLTQAVNRTGRYVRVQLGGTNYLSLAEVEVLSGSGSGGSLQWLVNDQLGTPRMVADKSGSLSGIRRHDYLPFGEELFAGIGGRTPGQGYVADGVRQQFAQNERDNETGLDYAHARYYSSTQGRFTSPDNFLNDTYVDDPASFNLYTYVRNKPLSYIDPSGEEVYGDQLTPEES